jgi:aryl-alcohol dehydrogenase-like predicted oxidoreductase
VKYRRLGQHGPQVSAIGLGRGAQPVRFGDPLEQDFNAAIDRAIALGINLFDSSDAYWATRHEVLLGRALKAKRNSVLIASKFGNIDLPEGKKAVNGRPEYVYSSCDASLERLGLDIIDIYYLHRVDPGVPIEETIGAMARLIEQGKVRWIGICEALPDTLKRAHATHPLVALQSEYSLWCRGVEREILPACRALGISFVPYAPLGRGLLTGSIRTIEDLPATDRRRSHPRFQSDNLARNVELVRQLEAFAARKNATAPQIAIAWLLAQGDDIVPIPGTNHANNVEQNVAALDVALSREEIGELSELFAPGAGAGERYNPRLLEKWGIY